MTSPDADLPGAAAHPHGRAGYGTGHEGAVAPDGSGAVNEMDVDHASASPVGPLLAGLAMLAFGLLLLHETLAIRGEGFAPDGPRFLPLVVVVLWIALSVVYLLQQVVRVARQSGTLPTERFSHMPAAALLVVLLVAYAYLLEPLGYIVATSVFFLAAARTMGSRQVVRDLVVGVGLSLGVYLLFTGALGVHLPEGVIPL